VLLLIPLEKNINWKNPPFVTIALVLINIFVFFVIQGGDAKRLAQASNYYFAAKLHVIEFPLFADYLSSVGEYEHSASVRESVSQNKQAMWIFYDIQYTGEFMEKLHRNEIITIAHPKFIKWKLSRIKFDRMYGRLVTNNYSFHRNDAITYITSAFLHGSLGHLVGNMLFLFIVGFAVERILGHTQFFFSYILGGLLSIGLWALVYPDRSVLGASGAISAVMGLYSVLFGVRKIRFFYWIVFYFDFVKAPAIILIPLWLLNEWYGVFNGYQRIAYVVHIGGYLGGAAIGLLQAKVFRTVDFDYINESSEKQRRISDLERGLNFMAELEFEKAKRVFKEMLQRDPDDQEVLVKLYRINKMHPLSDGYHSIALKLLKMGMGDQHYLMTANEIFSDYSKHARPTMRMSSKEFCELGVCFAKGGYTNNAEQIFTYLLKKDKDLAGLPDGLLMLATAFCREGKENKHRHYLKLLSDIYSGSHAAKLAKRQRC